MLKYDRQLLSYAYMAEYFCKAKTPSKGRPLKRGLRLYKEGNNYVVKMQHWRVVGDTPFTPLFKVSPKNVVTFLLPLEHVLRDSSTLVILLPRVIPIHLTRAKKGIYRISHEGSMNMNPRLWDHSRSYPNWAFMRKEAPQYFKGIKFNLLTGECLNPQPDQSTTELPEQRKVWRGELRRYKRGLKARIKVGALEGFIHEEQVALRAASSAWKHRRDVCPDWTQPKLTNLLIKSMRKETYPAELLQAFVRSGLGGVVSVGGVIHTYTAGVWDSSAALTGQHLLRVVDQVFTQNSEHFRRKYGVFGKTLHMKS